MDTTKDLPTARIRERRAKPIEPSGGREMFRSRILSQLQPSRRVA